MAVSQNMHIFAPQIRNDCNRNVAQLVAHYVRDVGVGRSSRLIPTEKGLTLLSELNLFYFIPISYRVLRDQRKKTDQRKNLRDSLIKHKF